MGIYFYSFLADISLSSGAEQVILPPWALYIMVMMGLAGIMAHVVLASRAYARRDLWRSGSNLLEWRPWWLKDVVLILSAIFIYLLWVVLLSRGCRLFGFSVAPQIISILSTLAFAVGCGAVYSRMKTNGVSWNDSFGSENKTFLKHVVHGGIIYLACLPVIWLVSAIYVGGLTALDLELKQQAAFDVFASEQAPLFLIYMSLAAVVIAPFVEEVIFRGILLPMAAKYIGTIKAVILVSVFFALIHGNLAAFMPLFVFAIYLSLAYIYSRSIVAPVVMHSLFNGINLVFFMRFFS